MNTESSPRRSTVLLADDHAILRDGLARLLVAHGYDVVGSVGDGEALLEKARELRPDVIVTDISMPAGPSGLDVVARLKNRARSTSKVIVLTMHNDPALAMRATRAWRVGLSAQGLGRRGACHRHTTGVARPRLSHGGADQGRDGTALDEPGMRRAELTDRQRDVLGSSLKDGG